MTHVLCRLSHEKYGGPGSQRPLNERSLYHNGVSNERWRRREDIFGDVASVEDHMQDHIDDLGEQEQPSCHAPEAASPEERCGYPGDQDEQRSIEADHEGINVNRGEQGNESQVKEHKIQEGADEISCAHIMPPPFGRDSLASHFLSFHSGWCDNHAPEECRHAKQRDELFRSLPPPSRRRYRSRPTRRWSRPLPSKEAAAFPGSQPLLWRGEIAGCPRREPGTPLHRQRPGAESPLPIVG